MNFNLLFAIVGDLSFVIDFEILPGERQDFLFFEGTNASAHLFRENDTVILYVNREVYKSNIQNKLEFSWNGFKINGTEMDIIKTDRGKDLKFDLKFDAFTFLSPILPIVKEEAIISKILDSEKLNYGYIFAIVFIAVFIVDSKPRTSRLIQDILLRKKDCDHEVMQPSRKHAESSV